MIHDVSAMARKYSYFTGFRNVGRIQEFVSPSALVTGMKPPCVAFVRPIWSPTSFSLSAKHEQGHLRFYWDRPRSVTYAFRRCSRASNNTFRISSTMATKGSSPISWWEQLDPAIAQSKSDKTHSYAQLSTIRGPHSGRLSGRPAVRTVNIRSFSDRRLYFVSDLRSGKADDIKDGPSRFAELAWFFPMCNKQFRLSGTLHLRSNDELANRVWADLHDGQRRWWAWPTPAEKRSPVEAFQTPVPENPPAHFCVCELVPDHVDLVDLSLVPYVREMHDVVGEDGKGKWKIELVNP